jgi:hypothetical protein
VFDDAAWEARHGAPVLTGKSAQLVSVSEEEMTREQKVVRSLFAEFMRAPLRTFPNPREELDAPTDKGAYVIYDRRGTVVHVGRTPRGKGGIAQRLRNHMAGNSSFTHTYLNADGSQLKGQYKFRCLVVADGRQRALLEAYAIGCLCPAHIGLG